MKKVVKYIVSICLILVCSLTVTGCGFKVEKEYEFKEISADWVSEEAKQEILKDKSEQEYLDYLLQGANGSKLIFNDDSTVTKRMKSGTELTYYYASTDEIVEIYKDSAKEIKLIEYKVDGRKLIQTLFTNEQVTVTITYKR